MVVHHVIDQIWPKGGAETIACALHRGLMDHGVESALVSLREFQPEFNSLAISLKLKSPYSPAAIARIARYIRAHCRHDDIIHTHLFPANVYTALAIRLVQWSGTLVTTEHSTHNRRRQYRLGRMVDSRMYSQCDRIFCISDGTKRSLTQCFPQLNGKLEVIHNGAALSFSECQTRSNKQKPVIVSVGRLSSMKNYSTAIRAFRLLDGYDFEYRIAGEGPERHKLEKLISELELEDRVRLLGHVRNVADLLSYADIFLIPSKWEGFGLAAVEAMNSSLPVVASNVDGLKEVIRGKEDGGLLVDPDSFSSIADALKSLILSYDERLSLGRLAFERSRVFSVDRMVQGYLKAYMSLGDLQC